VRRTSLIPIWRENNHDSNCAFFGGILIEAVWKAPGMLHSIPGRPDRPVSDLGEGMLLTGARPGMRDGATRTVPLPSRPPSLRGAHGEAEWTSSSRCRQWCAKGGQSGPTVALRAGAETQAEGVRSCCEPNTHSL